MLPDANTAASANIGSARFIIFVTPWFYKVEDFVFSVGSGFTPGLSRIPTDVDMTKILLRMGGGPVTIWKLRWPTSGFFLLAGRRSRLVIFKS
jgi:hypothetical protein